ncbi:phospho-sugar mutase [uncultured Arcanobacterium sp.]|uniref:phospho-sugar mutase n=1 Tax=uncultured Arcanobacterium sp. TaxID=487520 RepID=UPI002602EBA8|nr:phospho-sugar mutase [uncultured Arcanobacterium sp.]
MDLLLKAKMWLAQDPDANTRAALRADLDNPVALAKAFAGPLKFGTAGLRGELGYGESRMNKAVVMRATAGLMAWLNTQVDKPKVVIGCDARHGSKEFAQAAAAVVAGAGGSAWLLPLAQPTPLTAFSVRYLQADAGIMVTASHNPKQDNGYKVYLGGRVATGAAEGVQIVPPIDKEIAACIANAPGANQLPLSDAIKKIDTRMAYQEVTTRLGKPAPIKIVLTPMHGVGGEIALAILQAAGFSDITLVEKQWQPDPEFPSVPFPNPEEEGALDLAVERANEVGADLIIALDPDADRCAIAVPGRNSPSVGTPVGPGWVKLSGDETGVLIGEYITRGKRGGVTASSIVSGRSLGKISQARGLTHVTTLTGFKWISRTPELLYGYEEAIGHCVDPESVRDKDGIAAAVVVASIVAQLKAGGKSVLVHFDELAEKFGLYYTQPLTFRMENVSLISKTMDSLRSKEITNLAGVAVQERVDLRYGYRDTPGTDGILLRTIANDQVIIRPSGTEPKVKCYLEVVLDISEGVDWQTAKKRLQILKEAVRQLCAI